MLGLLPTPPGIPAGNFICKKWNSDFISVSEDITHVVDDDKGKLLSSLVWLTISTHVLQGHNKSQPF